MSHIPAAAPANETEIACRRVLTELLEIGMVLARRVRDEVAPAGEAAAVFERVSRAVRRTVRMLRWLDEPVAVRRAGMDPGLDRVGARKRVLRAVEDRIDEAADPDDAEALHAELLERLDTAELDTDLAGRPVGEVIGEICRDLGLELSAERYPSLRRGLDDLAALQARAEAAPGATRAVAAPPLRLAQSVREVAVDGRDVSQLSDAELDALIDGPPRRRRPGGGEFGRGAGPCLSG